jgi:hypothetical protein
MITYRHRYHASTGVILPRPDPAQSLVTPASPRLPRRRGWKPTCAMRPRMCAPWAPMEKAEAARHGARVAVHMKCGPAASASLSSSSQSARWPCQVHTPPHTMAAAVPARNSCRRSLARPKLASCGGYVRCPWGRRGGTAVYYWRHLPAAAI